MPKWLSSMMIVVGFLALIVLAFIPRNVEVTVTTNIIGSAELEPGEHNGPVSDALPTPSEDD
ncbi:MAG: hypothetical protein JKX88_03120 [Marinicaulis sp.]|nr:hypothetical protein [Marinicaulis sp.]